MSPVSVTVAPASGAEKAVLGSEKLNPGAPEGQKYNVDLSVKYESYRSNETSKKSFNTKIALRAGETVNLSRLMREGTIESKGETRTIKEEDTITFTIFSVKNGVLMGILNIRHDEDGKTLSSAGLRLAAPFGQKEEARFSVEEAVPEPNVTHAQIKNIEASILPTILAR